MIDNLVELNFEISAYVYELHELQHIIQDLAKDPETDDLYMQEIGDRYMKLCERLRIVLEAYFVEESACGLPTEFSYRKLYRQLTA